jgi:hypothetical protein
MSQRPAYTLEDIPLIHERQRKNQATIRAAIAIATLQSEWDSWLVLGDELLQLLSQEQRKGRAVDIPTDRAWGGLKRSLDGIQRLFAPDLTVPPSPSQAALASLAAEVEQALIGPSLDFLSLTLTRQWQAMEQRLRRLDQPLRSGMTAREALSALGLSEATARLVQLHAAYTDALTLSGDPSASALTRWEDALAVLDGGIHFLIRDAAARDAALAAFNAPFIDTVSARKAHEAKAKAKADAKADLTP